MPNILIESIIGVSKQFKNTKKQRVAYLLMSAEADLVRGVDRVSELDPKSIRALFKVKKMIADFPKVMMGCREYLVIVETVFNEEGIRL